MSNNRVPGRQNFESHEEYIEALKDVHDMKLRRRQLQDLGLHHMQNACENEDWDEMFVAWRYMDMAVNKAAANGKTAQALAISTVRNLASEEEAKAIDEDLAKHEKNAEKRAQTIADRINARKEQEDGGEE